MTMRLSIFIEFPEKKRLWKFHELGFPESEFRKMLRDNIDRFVIVNPNHTCVSTPPTRYARDGMPMYEVVILRMIEMPCDGDVVAICRLLDPEVSKFNLPL